MAQAFETIYNRNYKKQAYCRRDLIKQIDEFADKPPSEGNWRIESTEESKTGRSRQDLEELVNMVYNKRHRTTYFTSYCHDEAKDKFADSDQEGSDELINRGNRVFKKKIKKISPPLGTSRRLWGYMRPEGLYAPLSTYQRHHDHLAFQLLREGLPKEGYQAILDESRRLNAIANGKDNSRYGDDVSAANVDPLDPIMKQKLDKLDGLGNIDKKCRVQTLDGIVCGRPAVMKLIN